MASVYNVKQEHQAEYIGSLLVEMQTLAAQADLGMLAYLLAVAREEARSIVAPPFAKGNLQWERRG